MSDEAAKAARTDAKPAKLSRSGTSRMNSNLDAIRISSQLVPVKMCRCASEGDLASLKGLRALQSLCVWKVAAAHDVAVVCSSHTCPRASPSELIKISPTGVNVCDYDKRTPLHLASEEAHVEGERVFFSTKKKLASAKPTCVRARAVVKWLLEQNAELDAIDRWGMTPLAGACLHGRSEVTFFFFVSNNN